MTPELTPGEPIARFRAAIASRLGLQFDDGKVGFLGEVLWRRVKATGQDVDLYLSHLDMARGRDELGVLAQELTVPETYFFRNVEQYRALGEVAIPDCIAARGRERRLRIASLGCASGEEAYSLAILTREACPDPAWDVSIVGVDINAAMLEKARRAGERADACRELGEALRLLQREDASRVLLFGGGFGRDALVALCRTELSRCGGTP